MAYFQNIEGLHSLEEQEKWEDIRCLLYSRWKDNQSCCDRLIRLFSECWYVLALWDCKINTEGLSYQRFQRTLLECAEYGMEKHMACTKFLCIAGYMIHTLPHLFCTDDSDAAYDSWEKAGREMLDRAAISNPNDPAAKILNLGLSADSAAYRAAKRELSAEIFSLFSGNTVVELYFNNILKT